MATPPTPSLAPARPDIAASDVAELVRDTVREALWSWRLPATLVLGLGFGWIEHSVVQNPLGFVFGPVAGLYTLLVGPLPWRALVPLEEDGRRGEKLLRWAVAAVVASVLFAALAVGYNLVAVAARVQQPYMLGQPREMVVAVLLFLIGGWGLARDIQLEQRLDRSLGSQKKLSAALAAARLDALRADLDPHFLFNALNAIASQCATDPSAAEENVVRLATLLRAVLDTRRRPTHTLDEELSLAADYLGLLKARFPALRWELDVSPEARSASVPPLLVQPLLENAVRHGRIDADPIRLRARCRGGDLHLSVESPGGFRGERSGGMGLDLVRRRAALAWGDDATFAIGTEGDQTVARVVAYGIIEPTEAT